ncbi:DUF799 domain-containing protein [Endozoicomonas sp. Mp262]|uniref:DUF799 domain-containing protein n=1 Tax=Endozoicomonas sp. Mp262 TaxID=2919499 RepID=UPI0021DB379F
MIVIKSAQNHLKLFALAICFILAGCAGTAPKVSGPHPLEVAGVKSILILPVVNNSVDVDAPSYFLSSISYPLAERGYYVYPVNTVKTVLESEGLYDANLVQAADPAKIGGMFDADAILYVTIDRWDAQYLLINTTVTVEFNYKIMDGHSGEELWTAHKTMTYSPDNQSTGDPLADLVGMAINAAITRAAPNYMPLTREANWMVIHTDNTRLPPGPYLKAKLEASAKAK